MASLNNPTTKFQIKEWLELAQAEDATHVLIVCDTYDHEDYPVSVYANENVKEVERKYNLSPMQRVEEVYCLSKDLEPQLSKHSNFEY